MSAVRADEFVRRIDPDGRIVDMPVSLYLAQRATPRTSDRREWLVKHAHHELFALETIIDCLGISELGAERVWHGVRAIRAALEAQT